MSKYKLIKKSVELNGTVEIDNDTIELNIYGRNYAKPRHYWLYCLEFAGEEENKDEEEEKYVWDLDQNGEAIKVPVTD